MTRQPIVATDNGFVFRRQAVNDWVLVFTGGGLGHTAADDIIYDMQSTKNHPNIVWLNGGGLWYPAWSIDGGLTWDFPADFATASPPYFDNPYNYGSFGGGGLRHERDDDGLVLGTNSLPGSHDPTTNPYIFHASTDHQGVLYDPVFNWELATSQRLRTGQSYVVDGYMWWPGGPDPHSIFKRGNDGELYRIALDGTGFASFNILPVGEGLSNAPITGWHGSGRLAIWHNFNFGPICSIDISDPNAPVVTHMFSEVDFYTQFGVDTELQHVQPVTNQIILAMMHDTSDFDPRVPGAIIRSADGGVTWGIVVNFTDQLGHDGYFNEYSNFAVDPDNSNEVWACMAPPYVYHSSDAGATWEVETVDLSQCTPFGGEVPNEWSSIAMGGPVVVPSGFFFPIVTLIGAN